MRGRGGGRSNSSKKKLSLPLSFHQLLVFQKREWANRRECERDSTQIGESADGQMEARDNEIMRDTEGLLKGAAVSDDGTDKPPKPSGQTICRLSFLRFYRHSGRFALPLATQISGGDNRTSQSDKGSFAEFRLLLLILNTVSPVKDEKARNIKLCILKIPTLQSKDGFARTDSLLSAHDLASCCDEIVC